MTSIGDRLLFFLGSRLGHLALLILGGTWRLRVIGDEQVQELHVQHKPLILTTWHGRMMVPVWHSRGRGIVAMVSQHRDGELVSRMVHRLGYETVRGSSTRGGTEATLELLDRVRSGQPAAMICDGPRGPIYRMKPGTPFLAMEARAEVIPVSFAASSRWTLSSWDRFQIPKPFARVYVIYGDPITPPDSTGDLKSFTRTLEAALNAVMEKAEEMAGRRSKIQGG